MKQKPKPASKIPTTQKNTNQKKKVKPEGGLDMGSSLLKKNEFTLIIVGALVVTVLVFFLFFRSSDPEIADSSPSAGMSKVDQGLETRIAALEVSLAKIASSPVQESSKGSSKGVADLDQRVTRLETAVNLKLDSMIERMTRLEAKVAKKATVPVKKAAAKPTTVTKVSKPAPVPEKAPVKKKAVQPKKKTSQFHTVAKGETLWSISQKYNTSVAAIRKLNNLTPNDKIYPGNNILVR